MDFNGYKSWHIPRASLSSASNSGQSSTDSVRNYDRRQSDAIKNYRKHRSNSTDHSMPSSNSSSAASIHTKARNNFDRERLQTNLEKLHRGSRSSQGSTSDGISSLHVRKYFTQLSAATLILKCYFSSHSERFFITFERRKLGKFHKNARKLIKSSQTRVDQQTRS